MTIRRRKLLWIGISALYAGILIAAAIAFVLDRELTGHDKIVGVPAVIGLPTVAFVLAAAPVWRGSRNRIVLVGAAAFAAIVAVLEFVLTWGFLFPVTLVLLGIAAADVDRALTVSGYRGTPKLLALLAVVVVIGALIGLVLPLALIGVAIVVAILTWKLISRRAGPRATPS